MHKIFIVIYIVLLIACSGDKKLTVLNYNDPTLTVKKALAFENEYWREAKYDSLEKLYKWVQLKDNRLYNDSLKLKLIKVYGKQARYEKQFEEYDKIFGDENSININLVPEFYFDVGLSFLDRARLGLSNDADSIDANLINQAVGYFKKCYLYPLVEKPEIQSKAVFYAGISYAMVGNFELAYNEYKRAVETPAYFGTEYHKKAYFKLDNSRNINDVEITPDQENVYKSRLAEMINQQKQINAGTVIDQPNLDAKPVKIETDTTTIKANSDDQ